MGLGPCEQIFETVLDEVVTNELGELRLVTAERLLALFNQLFLVCLLK